MVRKTNNTQLRIIAGKWRGRKLSFAPVVGLRPTLDRIRETVFNWLQPDIADSHCLDLFAGSGAMGFEACSRGAARVDLVELSSQACEQLHINQRQLEDNAINIVQGEAMQWLSNPTGRRYDIVFIDPPFSEDLWSEAAQLLVENDWLNPNARIYLEFERHQPMPDVPVTWLLLRDKQAGDVRYCLFEQR